MGLLEIGYPGISELPTTSPVLCSVPSFLSILQDQIEYLRALRTRSSNRDVVMAKNSGEWLPGSCTLSSVTRCLGNSKDDNTKSRSRSYSPVTKTFDFNRKDDFQRPRSASLGPKRPRRTAHRVHRAQIDLKCDGKPVSLESLRGILKERLELLEQVSTTGGAASYGLSTTVKNPVIRAECEYAMRSGRAMITLAELVDAVVVAGFSSLPDAVAIVRQEWQGGGLRIYGGAECLLQPHLLSKASKQADLVQVAKGLHAAQASPTCAYLTWPLLRTVLECFQREQLRPTLDLILEMCSSAFGLKVCVWDVIVAASISVPGVCELQVAPWPVSYEDNLGMEQNLLAMGVLTLSAEEALKVSSHDALAPPGKVFPRYTKCMEEVVENELDFTGLHGALQSFIQQSCAHVKPVTLAALLARTRSWSSSFDGLMTSLPCGVLLWIVEKMRSAQEKVKDSRHPAFGCKSAAPEVIAPKTQTASMKYDLGSSTSGSQKSLESNIVAEADWQTSDDTENDYDDECDTNEEARTSNPTEMTPIEAFISCFYEDLVQDRPLYLTSVNNLFRMRSGGRDLNYRKYGYSNMSKFLAVVPGVELTGPGNQMQVRMCNARKLTAFAEQVSNGLNARILWAQEEGLNTSQLQFSFAKPRAVPYRLLEKIWHLFQQTKDHEVQANAFLEIFRQTYPRDRLHWRSLGYPNVSGLLAHVSFIEKIGGRGSAKYKLKEGASPPEWTNEISTKGYQCAKYE